MSVENDSVKFVLSWTGHADPTSQSPQKDVAFFTIDSISSLTIGF